MNRKSLAAILAITAVMAAGAFLVLLPGDDITYELDGGTNPAGNPADYNGASVILEDAHRDGYSFAGWYTDSGFTEPAVELSPDMGRITVYAKWTLDTYRIDYVLNGGTPVDNPATCTVEDRLELEEPTMLFRPFEGWHTDSSMSDDSRISMLDGITSDTTLYACWGSVVGNSYRYEVTGHISSGEYHVELDGKANIIYSAADGDRYLTVERTCVHAEQGSETVSLCDLYSGWMTNGMLEGLTYSGRSVMETAYGAKDVMIYTDGTSRNYFGTDWTLYQVDLDMTSDGVRMEATVKLVSKEAFAPKDEYTVSVHAGDSISDVSGDGAYPSGSRVTLTASEAGSKAFAGWSLDPSFGSVGEGRTFTIEALGCDITLYALCDDDVVFESPVPVDNPEWSIYNGFTGEPITTVHTDPAIIPLPDNGYYISVLTGTGPDGKPYEYEYCATTGDMFQMMYEWKYRGTAYELWWADHYGNYVHYRNLDQDARFHINQELDRRFVTYDDGAIMEFADYFSGLTKNMTRTDRANFVLSFVQQSISYQSDADWNGMNEYWKYAYETIYDRSGDCEDSSILYAAIMKAMGYDVALLLFEDHVATGIGMPPGTPGTYYEKNGVRYYYCETTATGWTLGKIPDKYRSAQVLTI